MKFTMIIESSGGPFADDADEMDRAYEVSRLLREVDVRVGTDLATHGSLLDINGNTVGRWSLDADTYPEMRRSSHVGYSRPIGSGSGSPSW